jgi:hypothetical protein
MSASVSTNENDARSEHDQYRAIILTPLVRATVRRLVDEPQDCSGCYVQKARNRC